MQPQQKPVKRLYELPEAAAYLACSVVTMRRLIWKGALPAVRFNRRLYLDAKDLDAFVETNKHRETF
ncbi:MAG: helix-turn-helix domain-containing protein [Acidobacteria bacterium]|nr:helix-turn-helix domain-containing protein [Acidobacteriota bacterium]MCI0723069.1 helix-turn-helix domain-containing protein [Acidobacteriota bacterium]